MKEKYITITEFKHYYGLRPFTIGAYLWLAKEPDNEYDEEAIYAKMPTIGKVGYVANSPGTVAKGTTSAGRICDTVPREFCAKVMFITNAAIICRVVEANPRKVFLQQQKFSVWKEISQMK